MRTTGWENIVVVAMGQRLLWKLHDDRAACATDAAVLKASGREKRRELADGWTVQENIVAEMLLVSLLYTQYEFCKNYER
jgi:putative aminopeptidase FrvX